MTRAEFDKQMARLAVLKFAPETTDSHWDVFHADSLDDVTAGVTVSLRTREFFPVPFELREDIAAARIARAVDVPPDTEIRDTPIEPKTIHFPQGGKTFTVDREHRYACEDCRDSGWQDAWCGDVGSTPPKTIELVKPCARFKPHDAHAWVRACPCRDTNPVLRRRHARELERHATREKVNA